MESQRTVAGYVVANGIDRRTADRLRADHEGAVVSRNANGTYRVTRAAARASCVPATSSAPDEEDR